MPYSYATLVQRKMARYFARKRCPICGRPGSGSYTKKIKDREYLYFAHTLKSPETGKVHIEWCYVGLLEVKAVQTLLLTQAGMFEMLENVSCVSLYQSNQSIMET